MYTSVTNVLPVALSLWFGWNNTNNSRKVYMHTCRPAECHGF